jgi:GT2 family glycosyltransferase
VVVDNHSFDGTAGILRQYAAADPRIRVHLLSENRGFAGGNNEAARQSSGEFLLLLNPDTIVTSGWLHRLMRILQTDPAAGIVAPVTNYSGNETRIEVDYSDLATLEEFAKSLAARSAGERLEIAVAPLFCALVSRQLWLSLGGLDERFQVGMFEDDDFSLRVRKAGRKILVAEDCMVHHFGSGSFSKLPASEYTKIYEENRRLFEEKWGTKWSPHRLRPGVAPATDDRRLTPAAFVGRAE